MSEGADPTVEFRASPHDEETVTLPASGPAWPNSGILALTFLTAAAASFLAGIAVASAVRPPPSGTVVASQHVGPSGGAVRFEAGEIRIPPGAVSSAVQIEIRRSTLSERVQIRPPGRPTLVFESNELVSYSFEPADLRFRRAVEIVFRPSSPSANAAVFARLGRTTLLLSDEVDAERGTVTIRVRDFRFDRGQPAGGPS